MPAKLKTIAIVNAYNEIAGPLTVLNAFLNNIDKEGFKIILFLPRGKNELLFENENVKVVYTKVMPLDKEIFSLKVFRYTLDCLIAFFRFIYFFKKYKVDILHNNSSNIFIASFAAQVCRIKIIYHIREVWNTRNKLSKVIYYYISRASSKVICITNTVKQGNFSKKDLKKFDNKFVIVTDCIEIEKFHQFINTKSKEEVIVSFVGRIAPIKGLDVLLKALNSLSFPDNGFKLKLRVIGDIPKENRFYKSYKKYILELAAKCQVNTNLEIQFYGFRNDVADLLKQSHMLVLPSRIEEGLGLVLAEGLICENFLITSNLGGQKEIVEALGCGLLFENDNHIDLAAKIEYYLSNSSICNSEIPNGKQSALTLFSPQTYSHLILAIYSKLACQL